MESGSKHSIYGFDRFRLDCDKLMLYSDGTPVTLPPRVIKTLVVLVENRGSILSKDELMERVWEDSIVEESNLSQNLYLLRKTLGSKPDGSPYIETLRRRGYRFTSESVVVETAPEMSVVEPALAASSRRSRYSVERRGNVVALVDWKEADEMPEPAPENVAASLVEAGQIVGPQPDSKMRVWAGIAAVFVIAGLGVAFWLNSLRAAEVISHEVPTEMAFVPLTNGEDVNLATISRDGKYFTYHENDGEFSRMVVQQTGQAKSIEILPRARRSLGAKAFSPDSQFIYFLSREPSSDHSSLYRIPALGGVQSKIAEFATSRPSFSPDGTSIAFQRFDSNSNSSLVISGADGTREKTVLSYTPPRHIASNPAWSPDGNTIAFGTTQKDGEPVGHCVISSLDLKTSEVRTLSTEKWDECYRFEWRRDGKGIVFVGTKFGDIDTIRRDQVYYLSVSDGSTRRLTSDVHWNQPDSLGITDTNQVLHVPFTRTSQLWVMDPGGSEKTATPITRGSSDGRAGLVVLPDGRIAFTARSGENLGAWTIEPDGSRRQQLISDPMAIEELRATPDGKYFFYATMKENRSHIYRVDADGANAKQITSGDSSEIDSALSPDSKWIVYDSASFSSSGKRHLWKTSIEGGAPTQVSEVSCAVPNFSSTGKYISCVHGDQIYVVAPDDGTVLHTFTSVKIPILNIGAKFTPDERSLVYLVQQKGTINLWVQGLDGKPAKRLTDFMNGDVYNFAYSPDGSKLYLARGFQIRDAVLISGLQ